MGTRVAKIKEWVNSSNACLKADSTVQGAIHDNFTRFWGFIFCRKLVRTKTWQGTDKAIKYNRRTVFSWALIFITHSSTGVVSILSYQIYSIFITLPNYLRQLTILPPPPPLPPTYYDPTTDRLSRPLGTGGHAKSYNRFAPWQRKEADTTMITYFWSLLLNLLWGHPRCC